MTNSEAIAFYEDHNRFMAKEVAADKRREWINNKAQELFKGEYSPFLPFNVQEAISELSSADALLLGAYLSSCSVNPGNDVAAFALSEFLLDRVGDYWTAASRHQAEVLFDRLGA